MKRYVLFAVLVLISFAGRANKLTIIAKDYEFDPAQATVYLGDTVMFLWATGTHTTTSTTIPDSAIAWDNPLDHGQQTFVYVPAVVGTYNYQCTPHASMGMTGSFTVSPATSVNKVASNVVFGFWPNPARSSAHVRFNKDLQFVSVYIADITGAIVWKGAFEDVQEADLNVSNLQPGRYIVYATDGQDVFSQKLLIQ
ncbi:MAG: T9SS type A sorting domain-containing protein [Bacteroidetes bacterium]|nr:T9SS type A sorting domain-containing protein [Bacteroidota bacterium]